MISINLSELIWTIINFFLLYFVLKRFLFDPVGKLLDRRQEKIDAGLNAEKQAQQTLRENRERLAAEKAEARLEANRILAGAEAEDAARRADTLRQARSEADDERRRGESALARQNAQEEALLEEKSGELTALLTARVLGGGD